MQTEDAYSFGHPFCPFWDIWAFVRHVETNDTLYRLDIIPVSDIFTELNIFTESDISPNIGFHIAPATGVACRQETLTSPTLGLASFLMLRPISPEQPSCFRTFEFRTSLDTSVLLRLLTHTYNNHFSLKRDNC